MSFYDEMKEKARYENDKAWYWQNCACLLDSKLRLKDMEAGKYISHLESLTSELKEELKAKDEDLFSARQELFSMGLKLTSNVQIEGQPASGLSRSNAWLGSAKGEK